MREAIQILLIEDNPGDVRLATIALERSGLLAECKHMADGEQALRFLKQKLESSPKDLPDVVLLDLNLPILDGREVLKHLKANPHLRHIPVIVLTSSDSDLDVEKAYALKASGYFCKPHHVQGFERIIKQIIQFWPDYQLCKEDESFRKPIRTAQ